MHHERRRDERNGAGRLPAEEGRDSGRADRERKHPRMGVALERVHAGQADAVLERERGEHGQLRPGGQAELAR